MKTLLRKMDKTRPPILFTQTHNKIDNSKKFNHNYHNYHKCNKFTIKYNLNLSPINSYKPLIKYPKFVKFQRFLQYVIVKTNMKNLLK